MSAIGISLVDYYFSAGGTARAIGGGYGSIITIIITTCIFALLYDTDVKQKVASKTIVFISGVTLEIYLGYIVSDRFTNDIITNYFANLSTGYHFKLYFIEVPLNFIIGLVMASLFTIILYILKEIYKKVTKSNSFSTQKIEKKKWYNKTNLD